MTCVRGSLRRTMLRSIHAVALLRMQVGHPIGLVPHTSQLMAVSASQTCTMLQKREAKEAKLQEKSSQLASEVRRS